MARGGRPLSATHEKSQGALQRTSRRPAIEPGRIMRVPDRASGGPGGKVGAGADFERSPQARCT
jgi:hypothetical protein